MKLTSTEKNRFELAICKLKGRWPESDNSDLFATNDDGEYTNSEIKLMSDGWVLNSGNITLSSFIEGRYNFLTEQLDKIVESKLIPPDLATKINLSKFHNEKYIDQMDYASDAYCALFSEEDLLVEAINHILEKSKKDNENA